VLACWSGLGYYRALACCIRLRISDVGISGALPDSASGLRELPGIGEYYICSDCEHCVRRACGGCDGNVERVMRGIWGCDASSAFFCEGGSCCGGNYWISSVPEISTRPMMELGATVVCRGIHCACNAPCRGSALRAEKSNAARKKMLRREVAYALVRAQRAGVAGAASTGCFADGEYVECRSRSGRDGA